MRGRAAKEFTLALALLLFAFHAADAQARRDAQEEWRHYHSAGNFAVSRGRMGEGEAMYREAVRVAEQFGEDDWRLVGSLRSLGVVLKGKGQYDGDRAATDEAEKIFRRLLRIAEKSFDPDTARFDETTREVLMSLHGLAEIHEARGQFAEAEAFCRRCLDIQRGMYRRNRSGKYRRAYWAEVSFVTQFYCRRGMYAEAKAVHKNFVPDCVREAEEKAVRGKKPEQDEKREQNRER